MVPKTGDVLVSNPSATVEHDVCIVPNRPHLTCPNHDSAVSAGVALAKELRVDAWLTEDRIHFLRLATYRETDSPAG
jgi:hypothetical protein